MRPSRAHGSSPRRASSYTVERGRASIAATSEAVITSSRVIRRRRRGNSPPASSREIALISLLHEIARIVRASRRMSEPALESPRVLLRFVRHLLRCQSTPPPLFLLFPAARRPTVYACALTAFAPPRCPSINCFRLQALLVPPHARPATNPLCPSLPPTQPTNALVRPMFGLVTTGDLAGSEGHSLRHSVPTCPKSRRRCRSRVSEAADLGATARAAGNGITSDLRGLQAAPWRLPS